MYVQQLCPGRPARVLYLEDDDLIHRGRRRGQPHNTKHTYMNQITSNHKTSMTLPSLVTTTTTTVTIISTTTTTTIISTTTTTTTTTTITTITTPGCERPERVGSRHARVVQLQRSFLRWSSEGDHVPRGVGDHQMPRVQADQHPHEADRDPLRLEWGNELAFMGRSSMPSIAVSQLIRT